VGYFHPQTDTATFTAMMTQFIHGRDRNGTSVRTGKIMESTRWRLPIADYEL